MITHRNNKGFTLIESMVAIVISTMLIAAVTATYVVQSRSFSAQDDVAEINTQSKMAHDIIKNTIKGAPFSYWPEMADNVPAVIYGFSNSNIITPTDRNTAPDAISILTPLEIGHIWPFGFSAGSGLPCDGRVNPELSSGALSGSLTLTGTVQPVAGSYLLLSGREFAIVSTYTPATSTVTFTTNTGQNHVLSDTTGDNVCNRGATVFMLIDTTFCVDADNHLRRIRMGSNPALCTGAFGGEFDQIIAENIEDLQFAYAVDTAAPIGEIDGSADMLTDDDFMSNPPAASFSAIRAVRINILTRTEKMGTSYEGLGNPPLIVENRQHMQPGDDFKRRWMQSIVLIKNLEQEIQ
jgi:prepilin-type N-terminal cleavage/methylation domain-containing protein